MDLWCEPGPADYSMPSLTFKRTLPGSEHRDIVRITGHSCQGNLNICQLLKRVFLTQAKIDQSNAIYKHAKLIVILYCCRDGKISKHNINNTYYK